MRTYPGTLCAACACVTCGRRAERAPARWRRDVLAWTVPSDADGERKGGETGAAKSVRGWLGRGDNEAE